MNIRRYLFLVVFDGQFELRQVVTLPGVQLLALVVSVVQYGFQFSGTPGLVQKVFGKALALLRQLLVLLPKLVLHLRRKEEVAFVSFLSFQRRGERNQEGPTLLSSLSSQPNLKAVRMGSSLDSAMSDGEARAL